MDKILKKFEPLLFRSSKFQLFNSSVRANFSKSSKLKSESHGAVDTFTQLGPYKIRYKISGSGPHPVLCLPGGLGFIEADFRPQLNSFGDPNFTLVAWDPPGYGKSRPPQREFPVMEEMFKNDARVGVSLMQKLGHEKFSILGWSDGGMTGLILAAMFPESVKKLIVWGAKAFAGKRDLGICEKMSDLDSWSPSVKQPMIDMYGDEHFRFLWQNWVTSFLLNYNTNGGDFCSNEIPKIRCPTLIIHGMKDPLISIEHSKYLFERIKTSKLHVMQEGKHNLHLRHPEVFNSIVTEFLLC